MSEEKKETHLRFLHCSDIHLDAPFVGLTAEKSEERRRVLRSSFMRMMQYVRDSKINVVLMSGDIFDIEYATNTTAEVLIREIKNCPDTVFIIAPGQRDFYNGNPIYFSPEPEIPKGSAFSCGVTIGEIKKNYIAPHHQFFMAMGKSFKRKIELDADSTDLRKYLHGEEIEAHCENGWAAVTVNGCTVGGAKVSGGRAKNHYPKGLRTKNL